MAAVGALSMALGSLNFGLFVKPIGDELGIGRSVFGWARSARQVSSAVTAPVVGGQIDRFGVRTLLTTAAVTTGAGLICLAFISAGWQLVDAFGWRTAWILLAVLGAVVLALTPSPQAKPTVLPSRLPLREGSGEDVLTGRLPH